MIFPPLGLSTLLHFHRCLKCAVELSYVVYIMRNIYHKRKLGQQLTVVAQLARRKQVVRLLAFTNIHNQTRRAPHLLTSQHYPPRGDTTRHVVPGVAWTSLCFEHEMIWDTSTCVYLLREKCTPDVTLHTPRVCASLFSEWLMCELEQTDVMKISAFISPSLWWTLHISPGLEL